MKTLLLAAALAGSWPALTDDGPGEAAEVYAELVRANAEATALDIVGTATLRYEGQGQSILFELEGESHVSKPLLGWMRYSRKADSEPAPIYQAAEFIADGSTVVVLEPDKKSYMEIGDQWLPVFPPVTPFFAWTGTRAPDVETVAFLADEARPERQGLLVTTSQGTETLWLVDKKLVSAEIRTESKGMRREELYTFTRWDIASGKIDPQAYTRAIPDDYEENNPNAHLEADFIEVGAAAPNVTLQGMDDALFQLDSLRGKTVLLNFWFYT